LKFGFINNVVDCPKLGSFRPIKGPKTFLVLKPQFFKTSRPQKMVLKTKTGLKDYITVWYYILDDIIIMISRLTIL